MKRFLPVMLALAFSAFAVLTTMFVIQHRSDAFRVAGKLRHELDGVMEELTEREEGER
jgi:hypothetical protein